MQEWMQSRPKQEEKSLDFFVKKDAFSPIHYVITLSLSPPLPSLPKLTQATPKYKTTAIHCQQCVGVRCLRTSEQIRTI